VEHVAAVTDLTEDEAAAKTKRELIETAQDPTLASSTGPSPGQPSPGTGDGSGSSDVPRTMAEATMGDTGEPISSTTAHPSVLVRLRDVYAIVENWAARHPAIERFVAAGLKSDLSTAERVNEGGGVAPVGESAHEDQPALIASQDWGGQVFGVTNRQLQQQLRTLTAKVDQLMSQQDNIAADVQTIEAGIAAIQASDAALATAQQALAAEIASLKAANPALDLSGLDKAAADVTAAASANSSAVAGISALPTT
jgi:hypothetical protein